MGRIVTEYTEPLYNPDEGRWEVDYQYRDVDTGEVVGGRPQTLTATHRSLLDIPENEISKPAKASAYAIAIAGGCYTGSRWGGIIGAGVGIVASPFATPGAIPVGYSAGKGIHYGALR